MNEGLIYIDDYCSGYGVENSFLLMLEEAGLIDLMRMEDMSYIPASQLSDLESYSRMYYELSINIEGIDVIHNLLERIQSMDQEMRELRSRLQLFGEVDL